jgi:hypothetical protein
MGAYVWLLQWHGRWALKYRCEILVGCTPQTWAWKRNYCHDHTNPEIAECVELLCKLWVLEYIRCQRFMLGMSRKIRRTDMNKAPIDPVTLLPCPFCGEEGKLFDNDFGVYQVNCSNEICYCRQKAGWREGAIDKWNARTTTTPSQQYTVTYETSDGELTGWCDLPVKRVEHQDDGTITVVVDYWPHDATPSWPESLEQAKVTLRSFLENVEDGTIFLEDLPVETIAGLRKWFAPSQHSELADVERACEAAENYMASMDRTIEVGDFSQTDIIRLCRAVLDAAA